MTEKSERQQAYLDAIRRCVCTVCLDQRDDGSCGLGQRTCAIEAHLPGIVEAVLSVDSDRMDDYMQAIEKRVCRECENGPAPVCSVRKKGDCALDTYLYLFVEAIAEVQDANPRRPS